MVVAKGQVHVDKIKVFKIVHRSNARADSPVCPCSLIQNSVCQAPLAEKMILSIDQLLDATNAVDVFRPSPHSSSVKVWGYLECSAMRHIPVSCVYVRAGVFNHKVDALGSFQHLSSPTSHECSRDGICTNTP